MFDPSSLLFCSFVQLLSFVFLSQSSSLSSPPFSSSSSSSSSSILCLQSTSLSRLGIAHVHILAEQHALHFLVRANSDNQAPLLHDVVVAILWQGNFESFSSPGELPSQPQNYTSSSLNPLVALSFSLVRLASGGPLAGWLRFRSRHGGTSRLKSCHSAFDGFAKKKESGNGWLGAGRGVRLACLGFPELDASTLGFGGLTFEYGELFGKRHACSVQPAYCRQPLLGSV